MTWQRIIPENQGGGRQPGEPTARFYESGQLTLSAALVAMLGHPERVTVDVDPDARRWRLAPSTPGNAGAFAVSGGGNAPARLRSRKTAQRWPQLIGEYTARRMAGGVELVPEDERER